MQPSAEGNRTTRLWVWVGYTDKAEWHSGRQTIAFSSYRIYFLPTSGNPKSYLLYAGSSAPSIRCTRDGLATIPTLFSYKALVRIVCIEACSTLLTYYDSSSRHSFLHLRRLTLLDRVDETDVYASAA